MSDRKTASTINDAELDQLYNDLARAETEARHWAEAESADIAAGSYAGRVEELEAALARTIDSLEAAVRRARRAEAAIARVRKTIDSINAANSSNPPATGYDHGFATARDWVISRVLEAVDARLVKPASAAATCNEHDGPCFPDPTAKCPAHGEHQCAACHRNPSNCADPDYVECGYWLATGMHWDTCANRIRGPLTPGGAATQATGHHYLSTGCLHGDHVLPDGRTGHQYCQSDTGKAGAKVPAQCKICAASCVCPCHKEQPHA